MKTSLSWLLLLALSLSLILIIIAYYLFSRINASSVPETASTSAEGLRKHAVTDLVSKLSLVTGEHPDIWPTEWTQIGSALTGCQLTTRHCKVIVEKCWDIKPFIRNDITVPLDPERGSAEKTGLAIRRVDTTLHIVACYSSGDSPITQKLKL